MPRLPVIHRLVTVCDVDGRRFASRIEDLADGVMVLARPLTLPLEHEFEVGRLLFISWPDPDGLTEATGKLIGARKRGSVGLWVVQQVGPLSRTQRRRYVRVPALGTIEIVATGEPGAPFPHLAGHLIDVSEAAIRCALRADDARQLAPSMELTVGFDLGDKRFTLAATVLRAEPTRDEDEIELVLIFDIDDNDASELRRLIFAEQLRQRRLSA